MWLCTASSRTEPQPSGLRAATTGSMEHRADSGRIDAPWSGSPGESHPWAPTESVRDSLPSYGSCRPGHLAAGFTQAQWAKYCGRVAAALAMDLVAFFQVRSFLYLFMTHRSR